MGNVDLDEYSQAHKAVSRFTGHLTFVFLVFGVIAFTVWAWVKGIRMARKLKLIEDVDAYKIKIIRFLVFLGTAGIGVSIFAVQELINIKYMRNGKIRINFQEMINV